MLSFKMHQCSVVPDWLCLITEMTHIVTRVRPSIIHTTVQGLDVSSIVGLLVCRASSQIRLTLVSFVFFLLSGKHCFSCTVKVWATQNITVATETDRIGWKPIGYLSLWPLFVYIAQTHWTLYIYIFHIHIGWRLTECFDEDENDEKCSQSQCGVRPHGW